MEGVQSVSPGQGIQYYQFNAKFELNATIISSSLQTQDAEGGDTVDTSLSKLYQGLSVTAQSVVDKINELIKAKSPQGVQGLDPKAFTPEATAERVVKSVTGLFDAYAKSNPELDPEALLQKFMDAVRSGVQRGYDDAFGKLKEIGAFEFNGVQDGVEQTKTLIETKLDAFEKMMKEKLGISPPENTAAEATKSALLAQAQSSLKNQIDVVA